jgi:HSP20 family protein
MELIAPGLKREDFQLNISNDTLMVFFDHKEEKNQENKKEGWIRNENRKQSFSRSFRLDDSVDSGKIAARYEDGVLHLSLPKNEKSQKISRTIKVQ